MKIRLIAVGERQPAWVDLAVDNYLSRLPSDFKVELKEVKAEPRGGRPVQRLRAAEAQRIAEAARECVIFALDERGKDISTAQLAELLQQLRASGESAAFVIGGPDGLDDSVKTSARRVLRLSSMTLPHGLARVLLAEQLYRAWSLIANHPYHRA